MKPKTAILLILAIVLVAAGAYAVAEYNSASRSAEAMAQMNQAEGDGGTAAQESTATEQSTAEGQSTDAGQEIAAGQGTAEQQITAQEQGAAASGSAVTAGTTEAAGTASAQTASAISQPAAEPSLRFIAVGDIMLGRGVGMRLRKNGGYESAFSGVSSILRQGDVVFANLESPLTNSTHGLDSKRKIVLKGKPEAVGALTSAGINLVSIANNHMMDYYETGLFDTMSVLSANHILFAGGGKDIEEARKPAILEKNGLKIGMVASSDMAELVFAGEPYLKYAAEKKKSGILPRKYETIREDIQKLRSQVDLVVVSLHWGVEDSFKVTQEQKDFARKLIDDGADIILGHHPHQFQGIEVYKGKPILYSMGNFLFDQNEAENMESFIVDMHYKGRELTGLSAIPVRILDKSRVEVQTGEKASNLLAREAGLCEELGSPPDILNDQLVFSIED
jgi:poly-gamma-glutamate synthesis protein (capsule biosynthesis protein)